MPHRSRAAPRPSDRFTRPVPAAALAAWLSCVLLTHHIGPTGFAAVGLAVYALTLGGFELAVRLKGPGRVLIVEDDGPTRKMLARFFAHAHWVVVEAETGAAALAALGRPARERPRWIVLDLMLADRPGIEILKYARTLSPQPRVAVTTGRLKGSPEWIEVLGLGADLVLAKPIAVGELMAMMETTP